MNQKITTVLLIIVMLLLLVLFHLSGLQAVIATLVGVAIGLGICIIVIKIFS